jgi:hypothetical protein
MGRPTPLGAAARGLVAGAAGTGAMTAVQELLASGGNGGKPAEDPWESAPAPAQLARRVAKGVFGRDIPAERIPLVANAMHWGYGTAMGIGFGLLQGTVRRHVWRDGLLYGAGLWALSYAEMVPLGLYEPPWRYGPKTLAKDLSYHVAYGLGIAAAYRVADR